MEVIESSESDNSFDSLSISSAVADLAILFPFCEFSDSNKLERSENELEMN